MEHHFNWLLKYTIFVILTTGGLCHMGCLTTEAVLEAKGLQVRFKVPSSLPFGVLVRMLTTNSACSFAEECKTEEGEYLLLILQTVYVTVSWRWINQVACIRWSRMTNILILNKMFTSGCGGFTLASSQALPQPLLHFPLKWDGGVNRKKSEKTCVVIKRV